MKVTDLEIGDMVYAAHSIIDDGSIPEGNEGEVLAPAGAKGVITLIGHVEEQPEFIPNAAIKSGMTYNELILKIFNEALDRNNMTIKLMSLPKTVSTENGKAKEDQEVTVKIDETKSRSNTRFDPDIVP